MIIYVCVCLYRDIGRTEASTSACLVQPSCLPLPGNPCNDSAIFTAEQLLVGLCLNAKWLHSTTQEP